MYRSVLNSPADILSAIRSQINKQTRPLLVKNFRKHIEPVSVWAIGELSQEPGKPNYPLKWKSIKQRKAYFASNGFGKGIPYKRSHQLSSSWKTTFKITARASEWALFNDSPHAQFVQGQFAQPFHVDRWIQADTIVPELQRRVDDAAIATFVETADAVTVVKG